jgi:hypothetical protein
MRLLRLSFTAVLLVFLTATLAMAASNDTADSAAVKPPAAVIPEAHHAFEAVVDGTQVTHDFAIRNTGDGPLVIQQVKTG